MNDRDWLVVVGIGAETLVGFDIVYDDGNPRFASETGRMMETLREMEPCRWQGPCPGSFAGTSWSASLLTTSEDGSLGCQITCSENPQVFMPRYRK